MVYIKVRLLSLLIFLSLCSGKLIAQCGSYSFKVNDSTVCLNQVITFKAQNVPSGSEYTWYLGLDTIKGVNKDTVSTGYPKTGSFNIKLRIKLKNGDSCILTKDKYIKVGKAPTKPVIQFSTQSLCDISEQVQIKNSSPGIAKWTWNVGQILYKDSASSVTHKFISSGYFDVSLTVEDFSGCRSTTLIDSAVLVERKPVVNLNVGDTAFCDTQTVFLSAKFNMYGQKGFSFDWAFPGATPSLSADRSPGKVFYEGRGSYGFDLVIRSPGGCEYDYNFTDTIRIGKSVSFVTQKTSTVPCNQQEFTIDLTNITDFVAPIEWDFKGDSVFSNISTFSAKVSYKKTGSYAFSIVHNDQGCISEFSGANLVSIKELRANYRLDKNCTCAPDDSFSTINLSSGIDGSTSFLWKVFDKDDKVVFQSTQQQPEVILNSFGTYGIQLNITDPSGCTDSIYRYGDIVSEPSELTIAAQPQAACSGSDIVFSVDSICQADFQKAEWRFFDASNTLVSTSTDQFPIMSFGKAGKYSAQLIYTTQKCVDTVFKKDLVEIVNLQSINYVLSDTTPCAGSLVNATLKVLPDNISPKVNWYIKHVTNSTKYKATPVVSQENEFLIKPNTTGIYDMKIVVDGGGDCIDSLEIKALVKVSGLKIDFSASEVNGCLPFKTTLSGSVNNNEHYDHPADNSVTYKWRILPSTNTTLSNPTSRKTDILIEEVGNYNVNLVGTNSDGCSQSVLKDDLFEFDFEAAFSLDTITCQNIKQQPTNNTIGKDISFQWSANSSNAVFHSKNDVKAPVISFSQPGVYRIKLEAITKGGCKDTSSRMVVVHPFSFDFSVENNTPKCTPAQYIFNIKSVNVDTFIWKFSDGKEVLTDQQSIAHVFDLSNIKPFRNDFHVSLIAQNQLGCIDTVRYDNLIKVLGPNPTFKITNGIGCNPLKVKFEDSTEQVERFYFNYGDGSSVDSISFKSHEYVKKDSIRVFEVFKPYIIASDKNNCFVYYQPDDSIVLYERPTARFTTPESKGCSPFQVPFGNHSSFATKSTWDYESNKQFLDNSYSGFHTYLTGLYQVKLVVENDIGCKDSLIRSDYIEVTEPPKALFNESDTILCPNRLIDFSDQSNATHNLANWKWYFGDEDSSFTRNPSYAFKKTGWFNVKLIVVDVNGCSDTIEKENKYFIVDKLPIPDPELFYVTVDDNNSVNFQWNRLSRLGYKSLEVYKDNDLSQPIFAVNEPKRFYLTLPEPEVVNRPISYQLKLVDRCDDQTRFSEVHRTIHLSVTREEKPFAILNWTPYLGWSELDEYVVYRSETGFSYQEVKRLSATDTAYVDFSVCDKVYYYLVGSVNPVTKNITFSNEVIYDPKYESPKDPITLELVTVDDDGVMVRWFNQDTSNVKNYFIDRHDTLSGWVDSYYETRESYFKDKWVESDRLEYKYRVSYQDFCDNRNPVSNIGSSILLQGEISNDDFIYRWNSYREWSDGVRSYSVEKTYNLDDSFEDAAQLEPNELEFIDEKTAVRSDSAVFVRIRAVENTVEPDTSYSNIIRLSPLAVVFLPNAFSPNGDKLNELFSFDGIGFVRDDGREYTFRIYNRWGTKVFDASSYGDFWDGTFKSINCPNGVYTYYLQLYGVDNTRYSYRGNVTLIR